MLELVIAPSCHLLSQFWAGGPIYLKDLNNIYVQTKGLVQ